MAAFNIFLRKTGEGKEQLEVTPKTTVADIKAEKNLKGYVLCFKGHRKDGDAMATLGVQAGDTINVCKTSHDSAYYAARRLKLEKAKGPRPQVHGTSKPARTDTGGRDRCSHERR